MKAETLAASILQQLPNIGAWQRRFLLHLFGQWLAIRGRHNFAKLARYGALAESTYRANFRKPFDFLAINAALAGRYLGPVRILAVDATFVRKSGRHTEGVEYFWNGAAAPRSAA